MNGFWIMLGLVALAISIGFHGCSQRYQIETSTNSHVAFWLDSMSGQVCTYFDGELEECTSPDS